MLITPNVTQVPPRIARKDNKEMLSVWQESGKTHVKINYSSLSIIQTCARKAYYSLDQGLVSEYDSPAVVFGSAIHAALERFYKEPRGNRSIPRDFVETSDLMAHGHDDPEQTHFLYDCIREFLKAAEPLSALPPTDKRSLPNGVWILQEYFNTYIDDPFEVYMDKDGPVTERRCEATLYEDDELKIILFGTVDVILQNMQTNVVLAADHKTSSMVGQDFYNRLKPNHQYTGYMWLAQECLGIKGNGFMVNCIQVKPRPKTARGAAPHFPRQVTSRSEEDIQEFKDAVVSGVQDFLRWKQTDRWPIGSVDSCAFWGGCQYLEVCGAPHKVRDAIIENKFRQKGESNAES